MSAPLVRAAVGAGLVIAFVSLAAYLRPLASQATQTFATEEPLVRGTDGGTTASDEAEALRVSLGSIVGTIPGGPFEGHTVTIEFLAASDQPRYTATLDTGEVIASNATQYELEIAIPGFRFGALHTDTPALGLVDIPID